MLCAKQYEKLANSNINFSVLDTNSNLNYLEVRSILSKLSKKDIIFKEYVDNIKYKSEENLSYKLFILEEVLLKNNVNTCIHRLKSKDQKFEEFVILTSEEKIKDVFIRDLFKMDFESANWSS